jgi:hypothetical protein
VADPLASSWAKLDRGQEHLKTLYDALLGTFGDEGPGLHLGLEFHEQSAAADGRPLCRVEVVVTEIPTLERDPHGLLIGDMLQAFRASLDHAAWVIANRHATHRLTAKERRQIAFPMTTKSRYYRTRCKQLLPDVPADPYLALIERYQPYKRNPFGRAIRALRDLSDMDKHRVIVPAIIAPLAANINIHVAPPAVPIGGGHLLRDSQRMKLGTKVSTCTILGGVIGQREVTVEPRIECYPELPGRLGLEPTLNAIAATCTQVVSELEALLQAS